MYTHVCLCVCVCVCGTVHCINECYSAEFKKSFIHNFYTWLIVMFSLFLMHCMNGTSPRQIPVHMLMSVMNKYPCIFVKCIDQT